MMSDPKPKHIKVGPARHAALEQRSASGMSLDHAIVPCENEASLDRLLILAPCDHEGPSFRDARRKSGVQPLVQRFSPTISEHLSALLEQGIEARHLRMDLTDVLESHALFIRQVKAAAQHQTHGSPGGQFDGGCRLADWDALLLHATETLKKAFPRHA